MVNVVSSRAVPKENPFFTRIDSDEPSMPVRLLAARSFVVRERCHRGWLGGEEVGGTRLRFDEKHEALLWFHEADEVREFSGFGVARVSGETGEVPSDSADIRIELAHRFGLRSYSGSSGESGTCRHFS